MHVGEAHAMGYTGAGVSVGVIDDGVQMNHPAYASQISSDSITYISYQAGAQTTAGCEPTGSAWHGTCVAGCITGTGPAALISGTTYNNTLAPNVSLTGIRLYFQSSPMYYDSIAATLKYNNSKIDIKNCSWGNDACFSGIPSTMLESFADAKANNTIMVFASGNARSGTANGYVRDAGKSPFQAVPQGITVAALDNAGNSYASFSSYGASVLVSAPGSSIYTTDRTGSAGANSGDYNSFTGTSAAAPVATGVIALGVEALHDNPNGVTVSPRLMKHLLVQTSDQIHSTATGAILAWHQNAAGHWFSPTYGFGRVNAEALVMAALETQDVTPQTIITSKWVTNVAAGTTNLQFYSNQESLAYANATKGTMLTSSVADPFTANFTQNTYTTSLQNYANPVLADAAGQYGDFSPILTATGTLVLETSVMFDAAYFAASGVAIQNLEEVVLTIGVSATNLNDLQIELESPGGTTSTLCYADSTVNAGSADIFWSFMSNEFWGETPVGLWKLRVYDTYGTVDVLPKGDWIYTTFYMGEISDGLHLNDFDSVPEPATWILLLGGAMVTVVLRRKPSAAPRA